MSLTTKSASKTFIKVPFSFEHIHRYKDAPEQVKFLREPHPHTFICTLFIQVFSNERELEFYLVKDFLVSKIGWIKRAAGREASCETIAGCICEVVCKKYGSKRLMSIEVSEDGLYSAIKSYEQIGCSFGE